MHLVQSLLPQPVGVYLNVPLCQWRLADSGNWHNVLSQACATYCYLPLNCDWEFRALPFLFLPMNPHLHVCEGERKCQNIRVGELPSFEPREKLQKVPSICVSVCACVCASACMSTFGPGSTRHRYFLPPLMAWVSNSEGQTPKQLASRRRRGLWDLLS